MHRSTAGQRYYRQLALAIGVLTLGVLVYALDRPADSTPHLGALHTLVVWPDFFFGRVGNHLPTFAHTFAFSVLTVLWLGPSWHIKACCVWLLTNAVFELGQSHRVASVFSAFVPRSLEHVSLVDALESYFRNGTFDVMDLVSIAAGAAAAYAVLRCPRAEAGHG